ncbi:MAG: ester cyclase, partial [Candidatus Binatia bacterium]
MSEPFVALMRRYVIDYTNSHDISVCDEIMEPGYQVHISGWALERDAMYKPAVESIFARFPGLCLAIHEIVTNGDRLAMRFSEHSADVEGRLCCWAGIALYRWNGTKLTECRVEQDFLGQRRQLASLEPDPLEPPHLDPWTTTRAVARDEAAEATVAEWLRTGGFAAAEPTVEPGATEVLDLFSAGARVAFHASVEGAYRGGLPDAEAHVGKPARMLVAGLATVEDGRVTEVK